MQDEDFVMKTINEGNVDIQKFPASKVCQLAKKIESSKAMAKHIRQVAGDIPAAQVQLMHHQRTQLPAGNYPRRKSHVNCKPETAKPQDTRSSHDVENTLSCCNWIPPQTSTTGAATHHMQKAFNVQLESSNAKYATNLATSHQYVSRKAKADTLLIPFMQGNQKHNNYAWGPFTPSIMQTAVNMNQGQKIPSVYK